MKRYQLDLRGGLLFTRAALKREQTVRIVSLLIDSGSNYTILSWAVLISLGLDPASSAIRRPITTAIGIVWMPEVSVEEFNALGQKMRQFPVLVHTIPLGGKVGGVLGMSFLREFDINLNFRKGFIEI